MDETKPVYQRVKGGLLMRPAGSSGPFTLAVDAPDKAGTEDRPPVIQTRIDEEIKVRMDPRAVATVLRWSCRVQLEQLAQVREWLAGDLRSVRRQKRVCMALANLAGFEPGERFGLFLDSYNAAGVFVQRLLPECTGGRKGDLLWLKPPPDARLPKESREAARAQRIVPTKGANPIAVALLGAALQIADDIVRADLERSDAEVDAASEEAA